MAPSTNAKSLLSLIQTSTSLLSLQTLHAATLRHHPSNLSFTAALASRYSLLSFPHFSHSLLSTLPFTPLPPFTSTFSFNLLLRAYTDSNLHDQALSLYFHLLGSSPGTYPQLEPDRFTFPPVIKSCCYLCDVEAGVRIHKDAERLGLVGDLAISNALVFMYGKCGDVAAAQKVFDGMSERNVVSWTAMIGCLGRNGRREEGFWLFKRMMEQGIRPNRATFLNVIPCAVNGEEADELYSFVIRNGLQFDLAVQNAMVGMFVRCRKVRFARQMFDRMPVKDLVSWSSMIEGYGQNDMYLEALQLFRDMSMLGVKPDSVTVLGVIRACANSMLSCLTHARFIHGFVIRNFLDKNLVSETALVDLYVKRGSLTYARRIFDQMEERSLVSWSTMISGYGMHGRGTDALLLFETMRGLVRVRPDHIVFVSVLSACSHAGLIDEGWRYFSSMTSEYGIMPRTEHYACMVDLLGRAGKLKEANEFIEKMPITPDSSVWGSLLGACRIHRNAKLAEIAAKELFRLDPENSGRYVLLSNIFSSLGKGKEADKVKGLMRRKGVKRNDGFTVIEVKNRVYKFLVGDKTKPQSSQIYVELEKLMARIKHEGYVPDTNFALHDVEEETKERSLAMHSEKLAIVFGLMNSAPGSVIRIHKNLRVCGDCHNATEYISKVTKREIVVRDSHRFHHFKDGLCSCGNSKQSHASRPYLTKITNS
ncbi:hypothetical protein LUZ63_001122 [Rhynchospora breviuscula]|uniref:DYW domain-containing protein n=1 Tax=Rhynchospora breviuscula TaxID=2022672 RepID=A0A9Q0CWQ5_9POAL|nr:hypothetical protein LUZ63_001122 [Rhynchospora breviuscula]